MKNFLFLIVCSFILFTACKNETTEVVEANATKVENVASYTVSPPFEKLDVGFNNFEVDAAKDQVLTLKNGTSIEIPAKAFVDAQGKPVKGAVSVNYREFHNAAQIIASGIPMEVITEKGEKTVMQTAGMFEIRAQQGNEPVYVAKDKEIMVNMASHVDEQDHDKWQWNETTKVWDNVGKSTVVPNAQKAEATATTARLATLKKPVEPRQFDKTQPALNFDIDYAVFPEFKEMKGIVWQYAGGKNNPEENKWIFEEEWDFVDIKEGSSAGQYTLELKNQDKSFQTKVCPNRQGKHFKKALKAYQANLATYESDYIKKDAAAQILKEQADFVRSFGVRGLGIYNCDRLMYSEERVQLAANFDFGGIKEAEKKLISVFVIMGDDRSVLAYPYHYWKNFAVDLAADNEMVAVLPGNRIATFTNEDFKANYDAIKSNKNGTYTFKMKVKDKPIQNVVHFEEAIASL